MSLYVSVYLQCHPKRGLGAGAREVKAFQVGACRCRLILEEEVCQLVSCCLFYRHFTNPCWLLAHTYSYTCAWRWRQPCLVCLRGPWACFGEHGCHASSQQPHESKRYTVFWASPKANERNTWPSFRHSWWQGWGARPACSRAPARYHGPWSLSFWRGVWRDPQINRVRSQEGRTLERESIFENGEASLHEVNDEG